MSMLLERSDRMSLLEKIADTLLAKNWIITLLSFVISVLVSVFVPAELFDKLPFDSKMVCGKAKLEKEHEEKT